MGAKYRNLFSKVVTEENFALAHKKTMRDKRRSWGYLEFKEYAALNLEALRQEVISGAYEPDPFSEFLIHDPKTRLISALPFKDRLVQHALCNVIAPIFDKTLLPYTFACRDGMGSHAGVKHVQARLRKTGATHFLKTDYSKFFPSIDRKILHQLIAKKVRCRATYDLLCKYIEPDGVGLPIGSLTSQIFANVYGGMIDRFVHFDLGHRHWARYMDDLVILGDDPDCLRDDLARIEAFSRDHMGLRLSKWQVAPISRGINFLGYRIWPDRKLLRKDSVKRAKRKIQAMQRRGDDAALNTFLAAWRGHAAWADTCNLMKTMEARYGIESHQQPRGPRIYRGNARVS